MSAPGPIDIRVAPDAGHGDPYSLALRETLREMPYNSATEFLTRYGRTAPDRRLGAACIHQTIDVARRASELGAPTGRILQDERHIGAVFEDDDAIVVLDPYLLHTEPIVFSADQVRSGSATVTVPAIPTRRDRSGARRVARLSARYRSTPDGYLIRLAYEKFRPSSDTFVMTRHFTLRSGSLFDLEEFSSDMTALLTHPEQTSLSVRAVLPELDATAEAILPLRGFATRTFTESDIWLRVSDGSLARHGTAGSARLWDVLTRAVPVSRSEITDHILAAARIYTDIADPAVELEEYHLEDH